MTTVHIDKGMAWGVPVGGFVANFIVGGLAKSYGIIMQSTQDLFNSSAGPLTLAGGLIYMFMYCLAPISILLCQKYGYRLIINIGALGCVISFILAYFAVNVTMWVIVIGGGLGLSLGFIYSPIFVMVGRCFRDRVGVAMGISVAGVSIGQIAFPSIITLVIEKYSVRGSFLIGAGIASHFFLTAAFMPRYIAEEEIEKKKIQLKAQEMSPDVEKIPLNSTKNGNINHENNNNEIQKPENKKPKRTFENIHIIMLIIFILAKIFGDIGDVGIAFALPPFGQQSLDLTNEKISLAIAVAGVVDLFTRVLVGIVSDQPWCRRSLLLNAAWFIEAINTFCFLWFPYVSAYFVFYGIFGLCSGTAITLMTVVITDLVGQANLPTAFAAMMFSVGLFIGLGQYLIGYLKDVTNTFDASLIYLGSNMLLAFILLSFEYPIKYFFFNTTSATADKKPKEKSMYIENKNVEENDNLVVILDPKIDLRSRLSSISTLSHVDVMEIITQH